MPIWPQFMKRDKDSAGMEPVGEGKGERAAAERGRSCQSKSLSRLDLGCAWKHVRNPNSVDLRMPLQGQQCGREGRTRRPGSQSYYFSQCDFGPLSLSGPQFPHLRLIMIIPES